jgi:hypothetical protein
MSEESLILSLPKVKNKLWSHFWWLSVKVVMKVQLEQMTDTYDTKFQKRKFSHLQNEIMKICAQAATKARLTTHSHDFVSCITKHGYFVS